MAKDEGKGPDNNKRLALLEASTSAIAAALVAANLMPAGDDHNEDPLEVAKVEIERLGRLDADNASLAAFLEGGEIELLENERPVHAAMRRIAELGQELVAAQGVDADPDERTAELEEQVKTLTEQLGERDAAIAKFNAGEARKHKPGSRQVKARKVGPVKPDEGELAEAIDSGDELELVFSSGEREIIEFEPVIVRGAAFDKRGAGRFTLREALTVRGAGTEQRIRGVGLMRGGKPVGFCQFPKPVIVPVGGERKFDRMIVFA